VSDAHLKTVRHLETWNRKKILRLLYEEWYSQIAKDVSTGTRPTVELGAGTGNFKAFRPDVISSDIQCCDWLDVCFDAHSLPFKEASISNIVMVDVLHHLANPVAFIREAARTLERRGRLILLEPYPSPVSWIIYKLFHDEPFLMNIDYFSPRVSSEKDAWDANQAIPYLLFFKHRNQFFDVFGKDFKIVEQRKLSLILYPLSGGFEHKALLPDCLIRAGRVLERALTPFRFLLAFRCYVVLERQ
jgi:SAM-dependent methyltransferase